MHRLRPAEHLQSPGFGAATCAWPLLLAVLLVCACQPGRPDLILVSIDTLRADHLGCYGYPRGTTPHIDRLAAEGVLFQSAISQAPSTLPSHASLLTSLLPSEHGALYGRRQGLPDSVTTVTEVLRAAGYRTAAFVGGGQVAAEFNLGQGFEVYRSKGGPLSSKVEQAMEWYDEQKPAGGFFLFLHTYEVHHPYVPSPESMDRFDQGYSGELPDHISVELLKRINGREGPPLEIDANDLRHIESAYDAGIAEMDEGFGQLIEALRRRNLDRNTAIVLTSDHGEEFGEHGSVGWHSNNLYGPQVRVPLILRLPDAEHAGTVVAAQVRSLDVAPTLLELAGVPAPAAFRGRSLLLRLGPDADEEPWLAWSQQDGRQDPLPLALRDGRFTWYRGSLYDLLADPAEQHDAQSEFPAEADRLRAEAARIEEAPPTAVPSADAKLQEETRDRLRALGYVADD